MTDEQAVRWVVSRGTYSDYRVMCVCDTKKRAQQVASSYNSDGSNYDKAQVEALPYVAYDPEQVTVYTMTVNVYDDGTTSDTLRTERREWPFDALYPESIKPVSWRWVRAPMHNGKGGRLEVHGTDRKRVERVLTEKRAQLLADDAMRLRREAVSR